MPGKTVQKRESRVKTIAIDFGNGMLIYLDITSHAILGQSLALVIQKMLDAEPKTANDARPYLVYAGIGLMYLSLGEILLHKHTNNNLVRLVHVLWNAINGGATAFIITEIVALIIYLLIEPQNAMNMPWNVFNSILIGTSMVGLLYTGTSIISNISELLRNNDSIRLGSYYIDTHVFNRTIFNPVFNIPKTLFQYPFDLILWAGILQTLLEFGIFQFLPDSIFWDVVQYGFSIAAGGTVASLHPLHMLAAACRFPGNRMLGYTSDHVAGFFYVLVAAVYNYFSMQKQFGEDSQTSLAEKMIVTAGNAVLLFLPLIYFAIYGLPKRRPIELKQEVSLLLEDPSIKQSTDRAELDRLLETDDAHVAVAEGVTVIPMPSGTGNWLAKHGIHKVEFVAPVADATLLNTSIEQRRGQHFEPEL